VPNRAQLVLGFGYLLLLGGCLFTADGGWASYQQYVQSKKWPGVDGRVVSCSIRGSWHYSSGLHVWGESSYVLCTFDYTAADRAEEATIGAGSEIFSSKEQWTYPPPKVTKQKMQRWIVRHPPGKVLTIHYNPSNPENISLAGADQELQSTLPSDRLLAGAVLLAGGLILTVVGSVLRKRVPESGIAAI
jgi:hypothetical protein